MINSVNGYVPALTNKANWSPATNPTNSINKMKELLTEYQEKELNQDQAQSRCWGQIKVLFLYRVNKLVKENLFSVEEVKRIGDDLVTRCDDLFSNKESAFANLEKIRSAFNSIFDINIETNSETLIKEPDYIAPDGSQIFLISNHSSYGLARCLLPQGAASIPARHKTVTEIWEIESGELELYCKKGEQENTFHLVKGNQIKILPDTHFQFRTIGENSVSVLIRTFPVWPGAEEVADDARGPWTPTVDRH